MTDEIKSAVDALRLFVMGEALPTRQEASKHLETLVQCIQGEPVLDKPARVGNGIFGAGLPTRYVVEAAQRLHEAEAERGPRTREQIHEEERMRRKTWEMFNGPLTGSDATKQEWVAEDWGAEFRACFPEPDAHAPAPAEVPMPEPDWVTFSRNAEGVGVRVDSLRMEGVARYGAACRAAGEAAGYARGIDACVAALVALKPESGVNADGSTWLVRISRQDCVEACAALRGEVKP